MNRKISSILSLAFVIAALASYMVYRVAAKQTQPQQASTTQILVAARDLDIGSVIKEADLSTAEWVGPLPKAALTKKETIIGRGVISQLVQGEPIVEARLAAVGAGGGLAATIPNGMRACAVRVNEVVGVAGFVVPGMRVDVIISGVDMGAASQGAKVKTILQNIQVLSAGTNIQKDNEGKPVQVPVVNLLVTPEQAEVLSLASNETRIQLVLRNPLDNETTTTPGIAMASLFSGTAPAKIAAPVVRKPVDTPAAPKPPAPAPIPAAKTPDQQVFMVQVLNGNKRTEEKFSRPAEPETKQ